MFGVIWLVRRLLLEKILIVVCVVGPTRTTSTGKRLIVSVGGILQDHAMAIEVSAKVFCLLVLCIRACSHEES